MDISQLCNFVRKTAASAGTKFTLDGEHISPNDLGDPRGLLPLVVVAANHIYEEVSGQRPSHLSLVEAADPKTHALGWRVKALPRDMPEGAFLLLVNHVIRDHLARAPVTGLYNPCLPQPYNPSGEQELRGHLDTFQLSAAKAPSLDFAAETGPSH